MAGPKKGARTLGKKAVRPDQGIGTASSKSNLKGKRKLRSPMGPNAEPTGARARLFGKDFIPKPGGRKRGRSLGGK